MPWSVLLLCDPRHQPGSIQATLGPAIHRTWRIQTLTVRGSATHRLSTHFPERSASHSLRITQTPSVRSTHLTARLSSSLHSMITLRVNGEQPYSAAAALSRLQADRDDEGALAWLAKAHVLDGGRHDDAHDHLHEAGDHRQLLRGFLATAPPE